MSPAFRILAPLVASLVACAALGQTITEFTPPTNFSAPRGIATGPDGNLWFTEEAGNNIGRITTAGLITEFAIPTASAYPLEIAAGPDGNLWFTEGMANKIGRITTAGVISEFTVPTATAGLNQIAVGPDSNLWFTEGYKNKIGRITTAGAIAEFLIPTSSSYPWGIVAGPDGNLWFTEQYGNNIGRISTSGTITEFPMPASPRYATGIAAGPDGALWYTVGQGIIGRITTAGVIIEFTIPGSFNDPIGIAAGPDGNLWFTELAGNNIGRITTGGVVTGKFPVPTFSSAPWAITAGPDGNLWFVENQGHKIGRITSCGNVIISAPSSVCPGSPGLIASVPDSGPSAMYNWVISGGTITGGAGTRTITFSAGSVGSVDLSVTVNDGAGCTLSTSGSVLIGVCQGNLYTLAPCRVADTRNPGGPLGGPALGASTVRNFLLVGQCGIPASARAVALNVTITQPTALGDLRFFPGGTALPLVSTTNYRAGQTRANNTIVLLGASGELAVRCDQISGSVHLIIDVNGYLQ